MDTVENHREQQKKEQDSEIITYTPTQSEL